MLEVGRIARPHGLGGQVVVVLGTDRTERLRPGSVLMTEAGPLTVRSAARYRDRWRVAFEGVAGRDAAEQLRGLVLSATPLHDPAALWVHELIGSEVLDTEGARLGEVVAVEANPASDLLVLAGGGLVPLHFVVEERPGVLVVDVPPGLLG